MASLKVACVVLMCMALVGAPIAQTITCGQVTTHLAPCINYLKSGGPVPGTCCNGVRTLNAMIKTTPDRQTACNCLKSSASGITGFNTQNSESLPGKCGVNIPYKISTSTNCSTIKF